MEKLSNERGVALVTALMLTLIGIAICLAMLYALFQSTRSTASQKRYSTAVSAGYGGVEIVKDVFPRFMTSTSARSALSGITGFNNINLSFPSSDSDLSCFTQKLKKQPSEWSACVAENKTIDAREKPDFTFRLKGPTAGQGYNVYTKITNTVPGNSDLSGVDYLEQGLSVSQAGGGVISPMHLPSMYTVEVASQKETAPTEQATLSVLYAY